MKAQLFGFLSDIIFYTIIISGNAAIIIYLIKTSGILLQLH